ncbi:MAG: hypothetical protein FJ214_02565 [Ignavibacteria bacterium]|nr:hypothetical protein [Ignavibacteria bacterium]
MKTILFSTAIFNRNRVKFLYGLNQIILEPYYVARNKNGKKVIYGKTNGIKEIKMFEYEKISNIKILGFEKFSPIIPIIPLCN